MPGTRSRPRKSRPSGPHRSGNREDPSATRASLRNEGHQALGGPRACRRRVWRRARHDACACQSRSGDGEDPGGILRPPVLGGTCQRGKRRPVPDPKTSGVRLHDGRVPGDERAISRVRPRPPRVAPLAGESAVRRRLVPASLAARPRARRPCACGQSGRLRVMVRGPRLPALSRPAAAHGGRVGIRGRGERDAARRLARRAVPRSNPHLVRTAHARAHPAGGLHLPKRLWRRRPPRPRLGMDARFQLRARHRESRGDASLERSLYCGNGAVGAADFEDYAAFMRYAFRSSLEARYNVANLGFRGVLAGPETAR